MGLYSLKLSCFFCYIVGMQFNVEGRNSCIGNLVDEIWVSSGKCLGIFFAGWVNWKRR
jgi:hypothetical protein